MSTHTLSSESLSVTHRNTLDQYLVEMGSTGVDIEPFVTMVGTAINAVWSTEYIEFLGSAVIVLSLKDDAKTTQSSLPTLVVDNINELVHRLTKQKKTKQRATTNNKKQRGVRLWYYWQRGLC